MSYTTRLLNVIPVRHRVVLGAIVAGLTIASVVESLAGRQARATPQPLAPIIIVATPTRHHARSLNPAKWPAPREAPVSPSPVLIATSLPVVAVVEPTPPPVVVEAAVPTPEPAPERVHERPSDKAGPSR